MNTSHRPYNTGKWGLRAVLLAWLAALGAGCAGLPEPTNAQNPAEEHRHFAAQVVGLQWLNPLAWMDYPTEWNTLWTLGLAKPNKDDAQVRKNPELYSHVLPVAGIAFNLSGNQTLTGYYEVYVIDLFGKLWERYFMNKHYFYSVASGRSPRREVGAIRVETALPSRLDTAESVRFMQAEITSAFGTKDPKYSSTRLPPDVRPHVGGPAAGFRSLDAALDYLETHPNKTVWVAAFDAPSFPKHKQLDETGALLILAHPDYPTGREPLAWLHRPQRTEIEDVKAVSAWKAGFADAAARGRIEPAQIGYVIHDAGSGDDAAARRLGPLAQAMTGTFPERDIAAHSFNTAALLGDLNAGTAATNLVLAIAYAHHRNTPVVVAGTRETLNGERDGDSPAVTTVLVRPPAHPTPFDPERKWFRASGHGNAYLPWWGRRHGVEPPNLQGWSD
ncbi:conserved hypothetical secreted protein [Azoarcus olearius]|uniref:Conserved hypothetical secreted protein n=1 Tax=Azoarcus sp. (strain BH72) TaxID=418699 RepID=A1KB84_AZOSB|nr:hypothetical protein [Azoarcus olearius]CAL96090.1 conserved hypothetical secreted protein [Azoarcus olearius]